MLIYLHEIYIYVDDVPLTSWSSCTLATFTDNNMYVIVLLRTVCERRGCISKMITSCINKQNTG